MSYHNLGDPNIIDRTLAHPKVLDRDVAQTRALVNALFVPMTALIPSFDFVIPTPPGFPRIGVTKATINKLKADPFGLIFDLVQNSRDFIRGLINRVADRSTKNTRSIGGLSIPMRAKVGDSLYRTMVQIIVLMTTDWFATHDELARMISGQARGTKGILGSLGITGADDAVVGGAVVATPAAGITLAEVTAAVGSIAALVGVLRPIIEPLLALATKDERAATDLDEAAKKSADALAAKNAAKEQAKAKMESGGITFNKLALGVLGALGIGYLVHKKGRKS